MKYRKQTATTTLVGTFFNTKNGSGALPVKMLDLGLLKISFFPFQAPAGNSKPVRPYPNFFSNPSRLI